MDNNQIVNIANFALDFYCASLVSGILYDKSKEYYSYSLNLFNKIKDLFNGESEKILLNEFKNKPENNKIKQDVFNVFFEKLKNSNKDLDVISDLVEKLKSALNNDKIDIAQIIEKNEGQVIGKIEGGATFIFKDNKK